MTLQSGNRLLACAVAVLIGAVAGISDAVAQGAAAPTITNPAKSRLVDICGDCKVEKVIACSGFLEGVNFDKDGLMWMTGLNSGEIFKIGPDRQCTVATKTGGAANGARFHKDGRLFITDRRLGLLAYDPAKNTTAVIRDSLGAERFRGLNDLIFDKDGGVYFTEPSGSNVLTPNGRVFFLPAGEIPVLRIFTGGIAFPNGIALSPNEARLYVAEFSMNRILAFNTNPAQPGGNPFVFAQFEGGTGPDGLTIDAAGNVYAAHFNAGEVMVVEPRGFIIGAIRLPPEAGLAVTNVGFHDGYLYITEAAKNEVWRVKTNIAGLPQYHQR
jgi:gluconolactonase